MVALFADESYDDHTYTLGGWVTTPGQWPIVQKHWRDMLATITMPDAQDPGRTAERIVFAVFHQDDWVGDYLPEYLAQIDEHLLRQPVTGARLVFWAATSSIVPCR